MLVNEGSNGMGEVGTIVIDATLMTAHAGSILIDGRHVGCGVKRTSGLNVAGWRRRAIYDSSGVLKKSVRLVVRL